MNSRAKITSKGQITLPVELRKELGLETGDMVEFVRDENGNYEILARHNRLGDLRGLVKLDHKVPASSMDDWIADARRERAENG